MLETGTAIIFMLATAWLIQFGFSFIQIRRFYGRVKQLNKFGAVWIGMAGSAWKRRQYVALVVNKENIIQRAEQLSGWTIFASLKPVQGLDGRPITDLMDDTIELPVQGKLLLAFRNAVEHIQSAAERKAAKEAEQTEQAAELTDQSEPTELQEV